MSAVNAAAVGQNHRIQEPRHRPDGPITVWVNRIADFWTAGSSGAMRELVSKHQTAESGSLPRSNESIFCSTPLSSTWKSLLLKIQNELAVGVVDGDWSVHLRDFHANRVLGCLCTVRRVLARWALAFPERAQMHLKTRATPAIKATPATKVRLKVISPSLLLVPLEAQMGRSRWPPAELHGAQNRT